MIRRKFSAQSGQVGLVVLLIIVVVATIGISVATRSSQDLTSSRRNQEAARTFSAAESALEKLLSQPSSQVFNFAGTTTTAEYNDIQDNTTVSVDIEKEYVFDQTLKQGESVEVRLGTVTNGNALRVEWGTNRSCSSTPASLIMQVISVNGGNYTSRTLATGPCNNNDNFTVFDANVTQNQGETLALRQLLSLNAGDTVVKIAPVYASTRLRLQAASGLALGPQQFRITSTGHNEAEGGRETKAVEVTRTQPLSPSILDYALLSGTTITKNN